MKFESHPEFGEWKIKTGNMTLLEAVKEANKLFPVTVLIDSTGEKITAFLWESTVLLNVSDQRCKCHPNFNPAQQIFNSPACLSGENKIYSGETGRELYKI